MATIVHTYNLDFQTIKKIICKKYNIDIDTFSIDSKYEKTYELDTNIHSVPTWMLKLSGINKVTVLRTVCYNLNNEITVNVHNITLQNLINFNEKTVYTGDLQKNVTDMQIIADFKVNTLVLAKKIKKYCVKSYVNKWNEKELDKNITDFL